MLEVTLPTPDGVAASKTENGESTGVWVLERIQEWIAARKICIWVLTNRTLKPVHERVNRMSSESKNFITVNRKSDVSSDGLPPLLKAKIARARH